MVRASGNCAAAAGTAATIVGAAVAPEVAVGTDVVDPGAARERQPRRSRSRTLRIHILATSGRLLLLLPLTSLVIIMFCMPLLSRVVRTLMIVRVLVRFLWINLALIPSMRNASSRSHLRIQPMH